MKKSPNRREAVTRSFAHLPAHGIGLILFLSFGCGNPAVVPVAPAPVTAESFTRWVQKAGLVCLHWPDGTKVLVWTDIDGMLTGGAGPSQDGVAYSWTHREIVHRTFAPGAQRPPEVSPGAKSADVMTGRDCVWGCVTADGKTGTFSTGGQTYDLAKGNVFLVRTANGGGVTQLTLDLSTTEMKHESFPELAKRNEVIGKFVADAKPTQQ